MGKAQREIALPSGVAGVGFRQTLENRERGLVACQRRRQIARSAPADFWLRLW
jgi:hypothetical protein